MRDARELDGTNIRSRIQLLPERLTGLLPTDGLFTFLLTVAIVYVTVVSIQSVRPVWADGLQILTPSMFFGVAAGYAAIKQDVIRGNLMHLLALIVGCVAAFWLTASAVLGGDRLQLLNNISVWFQRSLIHQQVSTDNSVFVLFLSLLTFLLAYLTIWLVFVARRPWLALVANAVVLLINMNQSTSDQYFFMVVFLVITLLLLVRFALAENVRRWRRIGLRFSPDLGWDFMQAGAIFAVVVALLPNFLPFARPNQSLLTYFTSANSPVSQIQQRFQTLFGGVNGNGGGTYGFFDTSLQLVGTVNLPDTPILRYTLPNILHADASEYLVTEAFSTYDGIGNWQRDQAIPEDFAPNQPLTPSPTSTQPDIYRVTFLVTPTGGQRFIFAPGSGAASFSIPTNVLLSVPTREPITYMSASSLPAGATYLTTGYVSTASISQLEKVSFPAADSKDYPQQILSTYEPQVLPISPEIAQTARKVTQGAPTMYAAASDLETYLHANFTYNTHNPNPPAGQDATAWFLQRRQGFCTFFASAMALMARSLGMPARIVSGYAAGAYDPKTNSFIVRGTQAHTWTQIYFGQYGWINFEPTASFSPFARALPNGQTSGPTGPGSTPVSTPPTTQRGRTGRSGSSTPTATNGVMGSVTEAAIDTSVFLLIVALIGLALAWWWRSLFQRYSPVAGGFARLALLGAWAGVRPKRSQTPKEYARELGVVTPLHREAIERVGALYSRERWGHPLDLDEQAASERLYQRGRSGLVAAIVRRTRRLPAATLKAVLGLGRSVRRASSRP